MMNCSIKIWRVTLCLLLFCGCVLLTSCGIKKQTDGRYAGTEKEMLSSVIDDFIIALDTQDTDAIKTILAPNVVDTSSNLDESIRRLFLFYSGNTEGNDWDENFNGSYSNHYGTHTSQIEANFAICCTICGEPIRTNIRAKEEIK